MKNLCLFLIVIFASVKCSIGVCISDNLKNNSDSTRIKKGNDEAIITTLKDDTNSIKINIDLKNTQLNKQFILTANDVSDLIIGVKKIRLQIENKGIYTNFIIDDVAENNSDFQNKINQKIVRRLKYEAGRPILLGVTANKTAKKDKSDNRDTTDAADTTKIVKGKIDLGNVVIKLLEEEETSKPDIALKKNLNTDTNDCCKEKYIDVVKLNIDLCMPNCKEAYITSGPLPSCKSNRKGKLLVHQNQMTAIKLINYNPFRYKIEIEGIEESLNQEDATTFSLTRWTKNATATNPDVPKNVAEEAKEPSADELISSFEKSLDSIATLWKELKNLKTDFSKMQCIKQDLIDTNYKFYLIKYEKLGMTSENIRLKINSIKKKAENENTDENNKLLPMILIANSQKDTVSQSRFEIKLQNSKNKAAAQTKNIDEIKDQVLDDSKQQLQEIEQILGELSKAQTTVYSMPYQVKAKNIDMIRFDIKKTDQYTNSTTNVSYNVFIRGGVKIDFSTGMMLSGLSDNLYQEKPVGTQKQIIRENRNNLSFLAGTLMNTTFRTGETLHFGISTGLGFSNDTKFQLLNGGYIGLGKFQRILFHGGMAIGKVDRLKKQYYENGIFDSTSNLTVETIMASWFAGITYNISKTKTEKPSQPTSDQ